MTRHESKKLSDGGLWLLRNTKKPVELASGFGGEAPRANAVIAIARSVLEEKKE